MHCAEGSKYKPAQAIRREYSDQLSSQSGDIKLYEGQVEEGDVAVEGLEAEPVNAVPSYRSTGQLTAHTCTQVGHAGRRLRCRAVERTTGGAGPGR